MIVVVAVVDAAVVVDVVVLRMYVVENPTR